MENFNLKKYLAESKLNEGKQTFPEDIWGEGKLPPLPDQKTWDEILAYMAMMLGESYGDKKSVIGLFQVLL